MSPLRGGRYYARIVAGLNLETSMSDPLSRVITRVAYGANQLPRIAWYVGA